MCELFEENSVIMQMGCLPFSKLQKYRYRDTGEYFLWDGFSTIWFMFVVVQGSLYKDGSPTVRLGLVSVLSIRVDAENSRGQNTVLCK